MAPQANPKYFRPLAAMLLLLLPLLTLWNLGAAHWSPKLVIKIGRQLAGVTEAPVPVDFSLRSFADGTWQRAVMYAANERDPLRPPLIQLSNQVRLKLFGALSAPGIVTGANGQLIEQAYVDEYCSRDLGVLETKARAFIPKLKALQDMFAARGHIFIYLITPSKMADVPESFLAGIHCPSTPEARSQYLPAYTKLLGDAGIRFLDLASLTHSLKGHYEVDVFPAGGVHWNMLGVANAAGAVLAELNRDGIVAPRLHWTYKVSDRPAGSDRELVDLINVLMPKAHYTTATVSFDKPRCADYSISEKQVAVVGGSFIHLLAETLLTDGCLSNLHSYNYLYRGRRGGPKYKVEKDRLTADDILPIADADIVLLEENEQVLPGSAHAEELYRVLTKQP